MPKQIYKQKNKKISQKNRNHLLEAIYQSYVHKINLNRFVTINLQAICDDNPRQVLRVFLNNYNKFCTQRDIEPAFIWVLENNNGNNLHAHILVHLPPNQNIRWINEFKRKAKLSWFQKANLEILKEENWFDCKTINYGFVRNQSLLLKVLSQVNSLVSNPNQETEQIGRTINTVFYENYGRDYQFFDIVRVAAYMLKGVKSKSQGEIDGRRFGRSHNLTAKITV